MCVLQASQVAILVKSISANAGDVRDMGLICELGHSPGGRHGNPLQCSCLENFMDRGAWQATVPGGPSANAGDVRDMGLILGSGRSPGGRHDNPHQHSYLENPMDRGAHLGYMT